MGGGTGSDGSQRPASYGLPPIDSAVLRQGHPLHRCLNVLNYVMQHPSAAPFCSQVCGQTEAAIPLSC